MGTLTKRDLVIRISNQTGLTQRQVRGVIDRILDGIIGSLAGGEPVEFRNFGIFEVKLAKARPGRNPKKPGSDFIVPARAVVKFKSGKVMGQRVAKLVNTLKRGHDAPSGT
jgi:nucleoid DNA-binding protein